MAGQSAVLDLLFDQSEGILKGELPEIQTLDFSNLGLVGEFDDLFNSDLLGSVENSEKVPKTPTVTDHDYVMQPVRSPAASSDSGVSIDSGGNSPRNTEIDLLNMCTDIGSMSGSPTNDVQFNSELSPVNFRDQLSCSPDTTGITDIDRFELDNFDFSDIQNVNFDTIDPSSLIGGSGNAMDEDISIDLGNHSDLITFDTTTNTAVNSDGMETKTIKIIKVTPTTDTLPFTMKDVSTDAKTSGNFPELRLTDEEKDLLAREGVSLPTDMPLTKEEERALKAIRRKIRNKVSAKESRKRKMDYVDGLEKRVKKCTQENQTLHKKVESLEKQNVTLVNQLKKLQSILTLKSTRTAQASTCVMVLLLSFAFLIVPNFNPFRDQDSMEDIQSVPIPGSSRNLLHKSAEDMLQADDNPYGITKRPAFWEQPQAQVVSEMKEVEVQELELDGVESQVNKLDKNSGPEKRENVVYVQIEKAVVPPDIESNVTYVSSEAEYKTVNDQQVKNQDTDDTKDANRDL